MKIKVVDFNKRFDEENVITDYQPLENHEFSDNGIYSKRIFGEDEEINKIAWIDLAHPIINPLVFGMVKSCIPNVNKMIDFTKSIDQNGQEVILEENVLKDENIGLIQFRERFDELLEKYTNREKYDKEYKFLLVHRDKVFIDKIPVFSDKLRPATLLKKSVLVFSEINNYYNFIIQYNNEIKDNLVFGENIDLLVLPLLYNIQLYANTVHTKIINDYLKGKRGFLRKNIMGSRINFSARNVITPIVGEQIDVVHMPYLTFGELYQFQLINLISTVKGINYNQAREFWKEAMLEFNQEMYNYMNELIKKTKGGGCTFLLNRNPTISIGSILYLKIGKVKPDYDDVTLGISNNLLAVLSGDYDGDVLNIIPIFDTIMKEHFSLLSPDNLIVNRDDGRFNSDFDMAKDQVLGIFALNNH